MNGKILHVLRIKEILISREYDDINADYFSNAHESNVVLDVKTLLLVDALHTAN